MSVSGWSGVFVLHSRLALCDSPGDVSPVFPVWVGADIVSRLCSDWSMMSVPAISIGGEVCHVPHDEGLVGWTSIEVDSLLSLLGSVVSPTGGTSSAFDFRGVVTEVSVACVVVVGAFATSDFNTCLPPTVDVVVYCVWSDWSAVSVVTAKSLVDDSVRSDFGVDFV